MNEEVSTTNEKGKTMNYYSEEDYKTSTRLGIVVGYVTGVVSAIIFMLLIWK